METADITLLRYGKKESKAIVSHEIEKATYERPLAACEDWHCWLRLASGRDIFICRHPCSPSIVRLWTKQLLSP